MIGAKVKTLCRSKGLWYLMVQCLSTQIPSVPRYGSPLILTRRSPPRNPKNLNFSQGYDPHSLNLLWRALCAFPHAVRLWLCGVPFGDESLGQHLFDHLAQANALSNHQPLLGVIEHHSYSLIVGLLVRLGLSRPFGIFQTFMRCPLKHVSLVGCITNKHMIRE